MYKTPLTVISATLVLSLTLYAWRTLYSWTDWSLIALLLLSLMLFAGISPPLSAGFRARLSCELRAESPLSRLLTGRIRATIISTIFVATAIPILAWQALTVAPAEIPSFIMLSLAASSLSLWIQAWLGRHLYPPFACSLGMAVGSSISALIFIPILAWIYWSVVPHPDILRTPNLIEAISQRMQDLPQRRGWIAEILAPMYAFDTVKLWLVAQLGSSRWITVLFSFETALVSFVVAHASAVLTNFVRIIYGSTDY